MAVALSMDPRERVLAEVDAGGRPRPQAAARFGVSAASTIGWSGPAPPARRCKAAAARRPPFGLIEADAQIVLCVLESRRDATLAEIQAKLAGQGLRFSQTTLWRLFMRHRRA
jgi:transposase